MTEEETLIESPLAGLSDEQIEELGKEFDAIHDEVWATGTGATS
jgi:NADPH-dependent stearoyl-CoA 9-desaturase